MPRGVAGLFVLVALAACSGGGGDGSRPVTGGGPIEIAEVPVSYRITYRIDDGDNDTVERLTVRRPFESRLETWVGEDADGEPLTTEIASFGRAARIAAGGQRVAVAVPPGLASADIRLDAVLDDAIEDGLLLRRGQREVVGRRCQVYRTGQTLRLVDLVAPTEETFVDACVDARGLVLEEVEGDRRRVAIEVEVEPALEDDVFDVGARTIPVREGGGVVSELTAGSRTPGTFLELGGSLPLPVAGRYAVVPPQPDAFTDPLQRSRRVASVADVLVRGPDVVVVERGGSLGGTEVAGNDEGASDVDLGALGTGRLLLTSGGPEVTATLGGGRYVRVTGTLPADDLVAVARELHEEPGGALTTVGSPW